MLDFTFLEEKQIFGDKKLEIIKKYGKECAVTDFSILLGISYSDDIYTNDGEDTEDKMERSGWWWTKTSYPGYSSGARVVSHDGINDHNNVNFRDTGARPALPYSSIKTIASNEVRVKSGIKEVEYGEYPQTVVDETLSNELEKYFQEEVPFEINLVRTGKTYTTDSVNFDDYDKKIEPKTHEEFMYKGKKYIRVVAGYISEGDFLSDGRKIEDGKPYWVSVEPVKWLIDEKSNIALSKKILFSGVQFKNTRDYKGDFENTDIKKFMNNYFSKEITPSTVKVNTKKPNPYGFKYDEVREEDIIKGAIESGIAVFLHGPSSEGKSARVKQIDSECVIIYLRNTTPDSLNGKSVYNSETNEMIDVKPTWLNKLEEKCMKEPKKLHILFFDEITNALPSIQGMAFNIILDREVNGKWKLPDNARIVAAGNDMNDSLAANKLAEPLFNRFAHVYIKTTTENWLKWASKNNIHPAIYSFIAYKNGEVLRSKYDGEKPNADPRKWEMASKMLYKTRNPEMLRALVGEDITKEFIAFCNQDVITLEDVLNSNYNEEDIERLNTSERYATTMTLTNVDIDNVEVVREFINKLGAEFIKVFDVLWTHNDEERLEKLAEINMGKRIGVKKNAR